MPTTPWWEVFVRGARGCVAFLTHTFVAAVLIFCIWGTKEALSFTGFGDHMLLDLIRGKFLFDAIDIGVVGVFGCYGLRDLVRELRE